MKYHAILGASYCGSTLLSLLLGKSEEVFSVGESHWLLDKSGKCNICSGNCNFFDSTFYEDVDDKGLIETLETKANSKYGTEVLLFSDKNEKFYRKIFQDKKVDTFLLLFKSPQSFASSWLKHNPPKNLKHRKKLISEALLKYQVEYILDIDYARETNSKVYKIFYDDLLSDLPQMMKEVCKCLGIKYSKRLLDLKDLPEHLHQIGGNFRVNNKFLSRPIKLDDSWKKKLKKEEIKLIQKSPAYDFFTKDLYSGHNLIKP